MLHNLIIEGVTKSWSVDLHLMRVSYSCLGPFSLAAYVMVSSAVLQNSRTRLVWYESSKLFNPTHPHMRVTWVCGRIDTPTGMFFNTRYIPVRRTQVPTYVSVEHWFALWTSDGCGGPILGLGFRVKNATAPLYTSFSLCLSVIHRLDRLLRFCLGSSLPTCCSAHHGMSLVSPSLLATCVLFLQVVFSLWRQGGRFFPFSVCSCSLSLAFGWYFVHVSLVCLYFSSSPKQVYIFSKHVFSLSISLYLIPLHSATTTPVPICGRG